MVARLLHDIFYIASLALNGFLIIIILRKTPAYLRCYSIILLYLSIIEISAAVPALLLYKKVLTTDSFIINTIGGECRQWGSHRLCFCLNGIHVAGIAHYAVMIAFCSCYRYYVLAYTRGEPELRRVMAALIFVHLPTIAIYINFGLTPILQRRELELAMNESHPDYNIAKNSEHEMLIVAHLNFSSLLAVYWVQGIIVPVFIVVIFSYSRINRILASIDHMSAASKSRHTRIANGLLCQAILPALYAVLVVAYRVEKRERIRSSEQVGNSIGVIGAILIALSPLFTLIFTPPYRMALKRIYSSEVGRQDSSVNTSLTLNTSLTKPSQTMLMNDQSG